MIFIEGRRIFSALSCVIFFLIGNAWEIHAEQVEAGRSVTMSVTADGTPPFTYQWQKEGAVISGAIFATYRIGNAQVSDAGNYTVVVGNSAGSVTSAAATLTVQALLDAISPVASAAEAILAAQPSGQIATIGHNITFVATVTAAVGNWQVSKDGGSAWSNLVNDDRYGGVTTGTLTITGVTSGQNGAKYRYGTASGVSGVFSLTTVPAHFPFPVGVAADGLGNLYVSDTATDTIQKISAVGTVALVAGSSGQTGTADGTATSARFNDPVGVCAASDGTIHIADHANGTIRRISSTGVVTTIAGSTTSRGNSDGNPATFSSPAGIARDESGNLYIADALNNTIRKITPTGVVRTLAGSAGIAGSADGVGTNARFNHPTGVAVDGAGSVYVADTMNNTIRKITVGGIVSTIAGLGGVSGAQDGFGNAALFNNPGGVAVDSSGNVYVADTGNSSVRKIASTGTVTTLAGLPGVAGLKDGAGGDAWFNQPNALTIDSNGTLFVADTGNAAIRKLTVVGVVTTLALSAEGAIASTANASTANNDSNVTETSIATPQSASSGSGGGAMELWFAVSLVVLGLFRKGREQFAWRGPR